MRFKKLFDTLKKQIICQFYLDGLFTNTVSVNINQDNQKCLTVVVKDTIFEMSDNQITVKKWKGQKKNEKN